jgi:hypothetical protein
MVGITPWFAESQAVDAPRRWEVGETGRDVRRLAEAETWVEVTPKNLDALHEAGFLPSIAP